MFGVQSRVHCEDGLGDGEGGPVALTFLQLTSARYWIQVTNEKVYKTNIQICR